MKAGHHHHPGSWERWGWGGDAVRPALRVDTGGRPVGAARSLQVDRLLLGEPLLGQTADALSRGLVGTGGRRGRPLSLQERF